MLVHGAWADGSCWNQTILPLRKEGLQVTCAPLPLTSLTDDVAALQNVVERTAEPAVLVGHAYGGAVIAGSNDDRVRSLVHGNLQTKSPSPARRQGDEDLLEFPWRYGPLVASLEPE